jgi:hypothetical protein
MPAPMKWGHDLETLKQMFPTISYSTEGKIHKARLPGYVELYNFPGDCNTLTINGVTSATTDSLKLAREFASANGFNKIVGTLVLYADNNDASYYISKLKLAGFRVLQKGISNRKGRDVVSYTVQCYIKNPKWKGYWND